MKSNSLCPFSFNTNIANIYTVLSGLDADLLANLISSHFSAKG